MDLRRVLASREELRRKVAYFAVCTRLFLLLLSVVSDVLLPDHDAGVFTSPLSQKLQIDQTIAFIFNGTTRWDAQYFLHIANFGYSYENTLAFFPLFPFIVRICSVTLDSLFLGPYVSTSSTILLFSLFLNGFFFVKAAVKLFDLSCEVLEDIKLAYLSALFFCINPASVFFTVPYTESCFAYFTFSGMLFSLQNKTLVTNLALGLSSLVRSNGIVNFGFIAHKAIKNMVHLTCNKKRGSTFYLINMEYIKLCLNAVIFFAPFLLFQIYAYSKFCVEKSEISDVLKFYGESNNFIMPHSDSSPWCNRSIPLSYSYVQNHYWNVGFLQYYKFKQIPNFLLAFPILYLVLSNVYSFVVQNKSLMISLGLRKSLVTFNGKKFRCEMVVFVFHLLFLAIFCIFFIHIQVSTRLLASSSPAFYWFLACRYKIQNDFDNNAISSRLGNLKQMSKYCIVETKHNFDSNWRTIILDEPADKWSYFCVLYFLSYFFIGTILFSNFFPWT